MAAVVAAGGGGGDASYRLGPAVAAAARAERSGGGGGAAGAVCDSVTSTEPLQEVWEAGPVGSPGVSAPNAACMVFIHGVSDYIWGPTRGCVNVAGKLTPYRER